MTLLNVINTPFWPFCSTLLSKLLPSFLSKKFIIPRTFMSSWQRPSENVMEWTSKLSEITLDCPWSHSIRTRKNQIRHLFCSVNMQESSSLQKRDCILSRSFAKKVRTSRKSRTIMSWEWLSTSILSREKRLSKEIFVKEKTKTV